METIREQVEYELESRKDYHKRLLALRKDPEWQDSLKSLDQQIKYQRRLIQRRVKTDSLSYRISRRVRDVAKAYYGIDGYYEKEQIFTQYILQIIKQAIEEVENGKEYNNNN